VISPIVYSSKNGKAYMPSQLPLLALGEVYLGRRQSAAFMGQVRTRGCHAVAEGLAMVRICANIKRAG
jgi:hypothetical protein